MYCASFLKNGSLTFMCCTSTINFAVMSRVPMPNSWRLLPIGGTCPALPGELTFSINSELVDEVVTVSDAEIVDAMGFLFDRMKLVVEPSGAVGIAALLNGRVRADAVGVVISGGNVGVQRFAELLGGS